MNNFSIGEAWSQAAAFLSEHWKIMLILVGGSVVLGNIAQFGVFGISQEAMSAQMTAAMRTGNMQNLLATMAPKLGGAAFVAGVIQSIGQFASLRVAFSRGEEEVGSALGYGVVAALVSFLFWAVLTFVFVAIFAVILIALGVSGGALASGDTSGIAALVGTLVILVLLILPVMLYIGARLWVMAPAMADARSANPIYGLTESWRLTRPSQWPLVGYLLLIGVATIFVFGLLGAVTGFITSMFGSTVGPMLQSIVTGVPSTILAIAISAGVYRALVPTDDGDIFA